MLIEGCSIGERGGGCLIYTERRFLIRTLQDLWYLILDTFFEATRTNHFRSGHPRTHFYPPPIPDEDLRSTSPGHPGLLIGPIHALVDWMLGKPLLCRAFQTVFVVELVQGAV